MSDQAIEQTQPSTPRRSTRSRRRGSSHARQIIEKFHQLEQLDGWQRSLLAAVLGSNETDSTSLVETIAEQRAQPEHAERVLGLCAMLEQDPIRAAITIRGLEPGDRRGVWKVATALGWTDTSLPSGDEAASLAIHGALAQHASDRDAIASALELAHMG